MHHDDPVDKARGAVAIVLALMYGATLAYMLYTDKPGVDLLIGALGGSFATAIGYYFQSSKSSNDKDKLLAMAPPPVMGPGTQVEIDVAKVEITKKEE